MKPFKFIASCFLVVSLASCASQPSQDDGDNRSPAERVFCPVANVVLFTAAQKISEQLECAHQEEIVADLNQILHDQLNVCAPSLGPLFFKTFCKDIGSSLIDVAVDTAVPDHWGCTVQAKKDDIKQLVLKACDSI